MLAALIRDPSIVVHDPSTRTPYSRACLDALDGLGRSLKRTPEMRTVGVFYGAELARVGRSNAGNDASNVSMRP